MPLSPYISFAGNCAEATAFYQQTLGAELLYKITFGEMPKDEHSEDGCPSGMSFPDSAIAHSNVRIAGSDIMMSDGLPGDKAQYAGFTLVLDTQDVSEGKRWFDNSPKAATLTWRGRKPSGRTASVKSPTNMACHG